LAEFVELVAGHPLLLRFVADWLRDEYEQDPSLERLAALGLGNLRELLSAPQVQGLHRRQQVGMVLVLDASFERLSELQKMLLLNGCVYRGAFDAAAVGAVLPEKVAEQTVEAELRQLVRRSLLQERQGQIRQFEFQPVVLEYLRYKAGMLTDTHQRAIDYYQSVAKAKPWQTIADIAAYLEIFYHQMQLQQHDQAFAILQTCDDFLTLRGYYTVILEFYRQLVAVWEQLEETEHWRYGGAMTSLGNAYEPLGQYQHAIECHQRSLKVDQQNGNRNNMAGSLGNLGNAYNSLGDYGKAIDYCKQSLAIKLEIGDLKGTAISLNNLGNAYNSLGDCGKAIDCYQQALAIKQEIGDHKGMEISLSNLGNACNFVGDYGKAIDYCEQSLAIAQEIGDLKGTAISLNNLGNAYNSLGDCGKAIDCYQQSLVIQQEIGDRKGEVNSLHNLAIAYSKIGRIRESISCEQQAQQIRLEFELPLDTMYLYPSWLNSLIQFSQQSWFHLSLCFVLGLISFPFAFLFMVLNLLWRIISTKVQST
jgi:tetratricopeptide (TPR) repeat protein